MSRVNIQDQLLYQARKDRTPIKIFLMKGLQLQGRITAYDMYSVLLESQGRLQLIFKHAISTIEFPERIRFSYDSSAPSAAGTGPGEEQATSSAPVEEAAPTNGDGEE
ncbi:MAG: RNA chaperone Hfq [Candidatus Wallbacteria bacterium]|nr:RNA chaperone Hfq [Candidatus Wallbacteria bacterium]MBI4867255.1 RNA chaperone Hfq [Candidatus Wallbacteria bacterium]